MPNSLFLTGLLCLLPWLACAQSFQPADSTSEYQHEDVVITGTLKPVSVAQSPVKIDVITSRYLQQQLPVTNLMEGISLLPGLQEVNACGVCYTNAISINGLPGSYTAVLIDGMPLYGSLASVYGLNGLPITIIERIEVIKGPNSTLYGSEAMAGVVNVITKNPATQARVAVDLLGTSHAEAFLNANVTLPLGGGHLLTGLSGTYMNRYEDDNLDGFGDLPAMDRWSLFMKWQRPLSHNRKLALAARLFSEDRRNGVEAFVKNRAYRQLRGSEQVYGESIFTRRAEAFGSWEMGPQLRWDFSGSWHQQDSYYGSDAYEARQGTLFSNLLWNERLGSHDLLTGFTFRGQFYDDNTQATMAAPGNQPSLQWIPGLFVQDEWSLGSSLALLSGLRVDHYDAHGFIPSPRISVKWQPSLVHTFRANAGTGFRIVNLFTEDHAFVTGQREVLIEEELKPEQSITATLSWHYLPGRKGQWGSIDLDGHFTHFSNKINPDYDSPGLIRYANSEGFTQSYGLSGQWSYSSGRLALQLGGTWMEVTETSPDAYGRWQRNALPFAPRWTSVATLQWILPKDWLIAYTGQITGPMALPEVFDLDEMGDLQLSPRPTTSKPFGQHHLRCSKQWGSLEASCGVTNLLDFRQPVTPLSGWNDPNAQPGFSPWFDAAYSYAPIHGREWFVGLRKSI